MRRAFLAMWLAAVLLAGGCASSGPAERTLFCMDTVMHLKAWGAGADAALGTVEAELNRLNANLDATAQSGALAELNRDGRATLDEETAALLRAALDMGRRTGGALDVTVYPLMRLWGFEDKAYRVPSAAEIRDVLRAVGYSRVTLEGNEAALEEGTELDFGAVAKGYAGDLALEILRKAGVGHALLDLGGSVHCLGGRTDGQPFTVGVQAPEKGSSRVLATIGISDGSAVTSGGYQRYFEEDGQTYWHILDPKTGRPADGGLLSVTVFCPSGLKADALSTALFVLGEGGIEAQYEEYGDFEAFFVRKDGSYGWTAGLDGRLTVVG